MCVTVAATSERRRRATPNPQSRRGVDAQIHPLTSCSTSSPSSSSSPSAAATSSASSLSGSANFTAPLSWSSASLKGTKSSSVKVVTELRPKGRATEAYTSSAAATVKIQGSQACLLYAREVLGGYGLYASSSDDDQEQVSPASSPSQSLEAHISGRKRERAAKRRPSHSVRSSLDTWPLVAASVCFCKANVIGWAAAPLGFEQSHWFLVLAIAALVLPFIPRIVLEGGCYLQQSPPRSCSLITSAFLVLLAAAIQAIPLVSLQFKTSSAVIGTLTEGAMWFSGVVATTWTAAFRLCGFVFCLYYIAMLELGGIFTRVSPAAAFLAAGR